MNEDERIEKVVDRVLKKLMKPEHQALVIFTGGALGYGEALTELRKLQQNGWNLKVALSRSAEYVFTEESIKNELSLEKVFLESTNESLHELYVDTSTLILPTLTMNTAAKIALGIQDTLTTNITSKFIRDGMPVIASKNACQPESSFGTEGTKERTPSSYIKLFGNYFTSLKEYGISLVNADELEHAVLSSNKKSNGVTDNQQNKFSKNIVTSADMMEAKNQILYIQPKAIVTALAEETANNADIKIVRLGE
jgi:hypothetical protein